MVTRGSCDFLLAIGWWLTSHFSSLLKSPLSTSFVLWPTSPETQSTVDRKSSASVFVFSLEMTPVAVLMDSSLSPWWLVDTDGSDADSTPANQWRINSSARNFKKKKKKKKKKKNSVYSKLFLIRDACLEPLYKHILEKTTSFLGKCECTSFNHDTMHIIMDCHGPSYTRKKCTKLP